MRGRVLLLSLLLLSVVPATVDAAPYSQQARYAMVPGVTTTGLPGCSSPVYASGACFSVDGIPLDRRITFMDHLGVPVPFTARALVQGQAQPQAELHFCGTGIVPAEVGVYARIEVIILPADHNEASLATCHYRATAGVIRLSEG